MKSSPNVVPNMKKLYLLVQGAFLAVVCAFISGCATHYQQSLDTWRFHDAKSANVVLQFSSWDYTFMTRPKYSDNGFLRQITRDDITRAIDEANVPRGMAVVTVGWNYRDKFLDDVVADWTTILQGCGFQRIVILRATADNRLNGAPVIEDTGLFAAAPRQTASLY